jgi:hypothetical protein
MGENINDGYSDGYNNSLNVGSNVQSIGFFARHKILISFFIILALLIILVLAYTNIKDLVIEDSSCYKTCLNEAGNTPASCQEWCKISGEGFCKVGRYDKELKKCTTPPLCKDENYNETTKRCMYTPICLDGIYNATLDRCVINISITSDNNTCVKLNGSICSSDEVCSGNLLSAIDSNSCCDSTCTLFILNNLTCSELNGFVCNSTQNCSGNWLGSIDSVECCDSSCMDLTSNSQSCSSLNGFICNSTQICSGSLLNVKDSTSCCNVSCTNNLSNPIDLSNKISGVYSCPSCSSSHSWYVDSNHMLWWDGKPYIPYGAFSLVINNTYNITDFNIWLDKDLGNQNNDPAILNGLTTQITNAGGTYIVQLLTMEPPNSTSASPDASRLADPIVKQQIVDSWKKYASAVSKEGLRGIVIWNEIDVNFKWPTSKTNDEYGKILGEYAKEAKSIFGDVPISFKTTDSFIYSGVSYNVDAVVASSVNTSAGGLGFDIYASSCTASNFNSVSTVLSKIEAKQTKPTWFWIAEFGVGTEGRAKQCGSYWANFPPFASKADMRCYMQYMIDNGVRGFIYAGPSPTYTNSCGDSYVSSYTWYGELKNEMMQRILSKNL